MMDNLPEPGPGFYWTPVPRGAWDGAVLRCGPLERVADHFFTARELRLKGDTPEVTRDWARVAAAIDVPVQHLRRMRQVHGCAVAAMPSSAVVAAPEASSDAGTTAPEADALVSDDEMIALAVQTADCVPVLMADGEGRVAATHAGWRGAAMNIAAATVHQLGVRYGVLPERLTAAIGPSVGPCCYQVGPDVRARFLDGGATMAQVDGWFRPDVEAGGDRLKLDMWRVTRDQLVAAGLRSAQVHVAGLCTACLVRHFYSYRVEGVSAGRLLGVVRGGVRLASAS